MRGEPSVRTTRDGRGMEGDRYALGTGHWSDHRWEPVTLVSIEDLQMAGARLGRPLDPAAMRRNVVTVGVRLQDLVGRAFRVGEVTLEGTRPCDPCRYLEERTTPGLRQALAGLGGLRALILSPGVMRRGDPVGLLDGDQ